MPFPHAPRARTGPRRRSLLAVAPTALLAAGCSAGSGDAGPAVGSRPPASERARARAARDSRGLAERYDAVIAAHAGLAQRLGPLREDAVRHAKAFESFGTAAGSASASPAPTGAGPSASASVPVPVPTKEKDALSGLAAAEREIADRRLEALLDASAELARLLASVAAAGAAHVFLLTEG
ncbi:lipoprotein [Streptomyces chlorus]|uniref:Lipoprotein n=1 Tax=Streptomyces chlorus TaxID=887452 RepID=A0ABW1DXL6_9ACTN